MLEITARAHGLIHLFDPDYEPLTLQEYKDYMDASAWFYMVLKRCVKTTTGENVIKKHIYAYNIPKVLAALAAEEAPRAAMMAAPRLPTVGTKVSLSHSSSPMTSLAGLPPIFAL